MDSKKFNETLKKKEKALNGLAEKNGSASFYLSELQDLILATDKPVFVVSKETFKKRLEAADFATIESDGCYHMLALVSSFPNTEYYMVWLESLSNI